MIVIISCGAKKRPHSCAARDLYTGSYFRAALAYALAIAPPHKVFILSAKWGLLRLTDEIEPYELKMGAPGSVDVTTVQMQACRMNIAHQRVVAVTGKAYREVCRAAWGEIETPLAGKGGLFKQIAWMREQARLINA